jgi:hypothetical protein
VRFICGVSIPAKSVGISLSRRHADVAYDARDDEVAFLVALDMHAADHLNLHLA